MFLRIRSFCLRSIDQPIQTTDHLSLKSCRAGGRHVRQTKTRPEWFSSEKGQKVLGKLLLLFYQNWLLLNSHSFVCCSVKTLFVHFGYWFGRYAFCDASFGKCFVFFDIFACQELYQYFFNSFILKRKDGFWWT